MKKKIYEQPEMRVVELEQTDVICTSTDATFTISNEEGFTEEDW